MKILVISNLYPPDARGGAEMIAKNVAEEAVRQGHDVSVLSTKESDSYSYDKNINGVKIVRYFPKLPYYLLDDTEQQLKLRLLWHAKDLFGSKRTREFVREVIKETAPDIIVTFNLRGMEIGSMAKEVRRSRTLWYHELHDVQLLIPSGLKWFGRDAKKALRWLWQSPFVALPYQRLVEHIMSSPDDIIGPSKYILEAHKKAGLFKRSKLRVLINPVELGGKSANAHNNGGNVTKLLFVGQLEPHKGIASLFRALEHVKEHRVRLDIVGNGSQGVECMNYVLKMPENVEVKMHGRIAHNEVLNLMKSADALVLPSVVVENCPGVILEARSIGLPIIASNVGGVSEFIDPNGLFEPDDVIGIANKIHDVSKGKVASKGRVGLIDIKEYVKLLLE